MSLGRKYLNSDEEAEIAQQYRWYLLGCKLQEATPVAEAEFRRQYLLFKSTQRRVQNFDGKQKRGGIPLETDELLRDLRESLMDACATFLPIKMLIDLGQRVSTDDNDEGSAGARAGLLPVRPVLSGCGAKLPPYLDPEPQWRDP